MVEGVARGIKYAMLAANVVIFMGGVVVFAIGVWTLSEKSFMERLLGSNLYVASAAILIATGIIVTIISFLGTLGAYREIKCILLTFFIILLFIFVVMLVGGILGYVFRSEVDERMHSEMLMTVRLYGNESSVTDAWDAVQRNFKCCGISVNNEKSYGIWVRENTRYIKTNGPRIPESCCKTPTDEYSVRTCQGSRVNPQVTFIDGCYEKMKEFVKGHALLVGGIGIGIACLLIFGMALSCALFMMIN